MSYQSTHMWLLHITDEDNDDPVLFVHRTKEGAIEHARKVIEENKEALDGMAPDESSDGDDWSVVYEAEEHGYWWHASVYRMEVLP